MREGAYNIRDNYRDCQNGNSPLHDMNKRERPYRISNCQRQVSHPNDHGEFRGMYRGHLNPYIAEGSQQVRRGNTPNPHELDCRYVGNGGICNEQDSFSCDNANAPSRNMGNGLHPNCNPPHFSVRNYQQDNSCGDGRSQVHNNGIAINRYHECNNMSQNTNRGRPLDYEQKSMVTNTQDSMGNQSVSFNLNISGGELMKAMDRSNDRYDSPVNLNRQNESHDRKQLGDGCSYSNQHRGGYVDQNNKRRLRQELEYTPEMSRGYHRTSMTSSHWVPEDDSHDSEITSPKHKRGGGSSGKRHRSPREQPNDGRISGKRGFNSRSGRGNRSFPVNSEEYFDDNLDDMDNKRFTGANNYNSNCGQSMESNAVPRNELDDRIKQSLKNMGWVNHPNTLKGKVIDSEQNVNGSGPALPIYTEVPKPNCMNNMGTQGFNCVVATNVPTFIQPMLQGIPVSVEPVHAQALPPLVPMNMPSRQPNYTQDTISCGKSFLDGNGMPISIQSDISKGTNMGKYGEQLSNNLPAQTVEPRVGQSPNIVVEYGMNPKGSGLIHNSTKNQVKILGGDNKPPEKGSVFMGSVLPDLSHCEDISGSLDYNKAVGTNKDNGDVSTAPSGSPSSIANRTTQVGGSGSHKNLAGNTKSYTNAEIQKLIQETAKATAQQQC